MNNKRVLYLQFFQFCVLIGLLLAFIPASRVDSPVSMIVASFGAAGCILWSTLKLSGSQPRKEFQTNMLVCLAFAELVMLAGTFLGSTLPQIVFAGVAWGLMGIFILPKLLSAQF